MRSREAIFMKKEAGMTAVVQTKYAEITSVNTSISVTLDAAPTPENLLVAVLVSNASFSNPVYPWGLPPDVISGTGPVGNIYSHVVASGESATVTFSNDTARIMGLTVFEVEPSAGNIWAGVAHTAITNTGTGVTSQTVGPTLSQYRSDNFAAAFTALQTAHGGVPPTMSDGYTVVGGLDGTTARGIAGYKVLSDTTATETTSSWVNAQTPRSGLVSYQQVAAPADLGMPRLVQMKYFYNAASVAGASATFDRPPTPGNLLVAHAITGSNRTITVHPFDNAGPDISAIPTNALKAMLYSKVAGAGESSTVSFNTDGNTNGNALALYEFAPADDMQWVEPPLDTAGGTHAGAATVTTLTASTPGSLSSVVGVVLSTLATLTSWASGEAPTVPGFEFTQYGRSATAYLLPDSTAQVNAVWSWTTASRASTTIAHYFQESASSTVEKNGTDTGAVSIGESTEVLVSFSSTDTSSLSITESVATDVSITTVDTGSLAVGEQASIFVPVTSEDEIGLTINDESSMAQAFESSDDLSISVDETTSSFRTLSADDQSALSIDSVSNLDSTLPANESITVGVSEQTFTFVTLTASDAVAVAVSEDSLLVVQAISDDSIQISISDNTATDVTVETTDTSVLSITESHEISRTLVAQDSIELQVIETTSGFATLTRPDDLAVQLIEVATRSVYAYDTISVSIGESSNAEIEDSTVQVGAADSIVIHVVEHANIWIFGVSHSPIRFASNNAHDTINRTENSTSEQIWFSVSREARPY